MENKDWIKYSEYLVHKELQDLREKAVLHDLMKEEKYKNIFYKILTAGLLEKEGIMILNIPMSKENKEKLKQGAKTTTVRSARQYMSIGLREGNESGFYYVNNVLFEVECLGLMNIEQAGGVEKMLKSEGLDSIEDCMFQQTKNWFKGKGKLYVYKFTKV